jgi:hypothetical protein
LRFARLIASIARLNAQFTRMNAPFARLHASFASLNASFGVFIPLIAEAKASFQPRKARVSR